MDLPTRRTKLNLSRLKELLVFEQEARELGFSEIAGIDEAGRGPLAGPVVAAACMMPEKLVFPGVDDSKKLTPLQREKLFHIITAHPDVVHGIGIVSSEEIDRINILQATILAMKQAVAALKTAPQLLLVDGLALPGSTIPSKKIIKGDSRSYIIASASILAKVTRDTIMLRHHEEWPHYGFASHKGYGTKFHLEALAAHGPCPIHRRSFAPLSQK